MTCINEKFQVNDNVLNHTRVTEAYEQLRWEIIHK